MDLAEVKGEIRHMIIQASNLKELVPEDIKDDQLLFGGGLGLDSIDLLELVMALQRRFGIRIKNDAAGHEALRSVETLAHAVCEFLGGQGTEAQAEKSAAEPGRSSIGTPGTHFSP
jgi:acyl carrier protein